MCAVCVSEVTSCLWKPNKTLDTLYACSHSTLVRISPELLEEDRNIDS